MRTECSLTPLPTHRFYRDDCRQFACHGHGSHCRFGYRHNIDTNGAAAELGMGAANTSIEYIDIHAGAGICIVVGAVERQSALVDAISPQVAPV